MTTLDGIGERVHTGIGHGARIGPSELARARRQRLDTALAGEPFDAFLAVDPVNVDYATGYRSVAGAVHGTATLGALVSPGITVVAGPAADAPSVLELGISVEDYIPHGRFFFESSEPSPVSEMADSHQGFVSALVAAFHRAGVARATVGVDIDAIQPKDLVALEQALPEASLVDASPWARWVRRVKLPPEVDRLRAAAAVTENAIHAAIDAARVGMSERDLQLIIASHLSSGGVMPRFVVATIGERSAYGDTPASADQRLTRGDLVRFDVGGQLDGYWSDLGRTAVVGGPDALQRSRYEAILAGEMVQLNLARPGVRAQEVFRVAVDEVERLGLAPYRRHHCGHGIGLNPYEAPIINPATDQELEPGMVFCFETPYYEIGWGGMMVEDTLVITDSGCELLSVSDRSLRVIEP
jgi:Xaa-Pro aminopeptidase